MPLLARECSQERPQARREASSSLVCYKKLLTLVEGVLENKLLNLLDLVVLETREVDPVLSRHSLRHLVICQALSLHDLSATLELDLEVVEEQTVPLLEVHVVGYLDYVLVLRIPI